MYVQIGQDSYNIKTCIDLLPSLSCTQMAGKYFEISKKKKADSALESCNSHPLG